MGKWVNFRELAKMIDLEGLRDPGYQKDHEAVKTAEKVAFFNLMDEVERGAYEKVSGRGYEVNAREALKASRGGKIDVDALTDLLFCGLMNVAEFEDYEQTKKKKPGITAKEFYDYICRHNEKDPAILKLADIFAAIIDKKETESRQHKYISRATFEKNKRNSKWIQNNTEDLNESRRFW